MMLSFQARGLCELGNYLLGKFSTAGTTIKHLVVSTHQCHPVPRANPIPYHPSTPSPFLSKLWQKGWRATIVESEEAHGPKDSIGTVAMLPCLCIDTCRSLGPTSSNAGGTARVSVKNLSYIDDETRTGAILHKVKWRTRRRGVIQETNAWTSRDSIGMSRQIWSRTVQRARAENAEEGEGGMTSAVLWLVDVHSSTICRNLIPSILGD